MVASITDRLREDRDRFVGFAFANADLLLELDSTSRIQWAGGAIKSILHRDADGLINRPLTSILTVQDAALLMAALRELQPGQRRRGLHMTLHGDGAAGQVVEIGIYRTLEAGERRYCLSITQLPLSAADHEAAQQRDRVTGLMEAVEFTRAASGAVQLAKQSGKAACLTLVEICQEEDLRRLLGPDRSEALMAEIGAQLKLHAIDHDTAGRLGDGRFGVTHLEDDSPAAIVAAIGKVGQSFDLDQAALQIKETTVRFQKNSLGEDDVEGILSYVVSKFGLEGGGALESGSADHYLRRKTAETLSRVVAMRDLIHERRITLHYQPIVSLNDRRHHHYEVLLRFADGRSPFEDVRFAEEINIIHELDLAVANGAIARILEGAAKGQHLSLAVNMSAKSLLNDSFGEMFTKVTERLGTDRKRLMIEITESAKLEDLARAAQAVQRLRGRGHVVCLDDFGAGASSLPYLQQLTVDYVKIDGVYIRSITDSPRERAIVQGVLTTCKCLGIRTVAEMIEKEDQHKCLLDLGVDLGQGWLYGKPSAEIPPPSIAGAMRLGKRMGVREQWA
ncbi:MAG: EAL domain-containing protein [Rhodospirillaceae bacterium]|nr:EAL domain-containing protein [Rhodospirillaceae bacterium]